MCDDHVALSPCFSAAFVGHYAQRLKIREERL